MFDAASVLSGAAIAFDLDGTLVDSAPDLIGTLNVLLQEEGLAPFPLAEARPFIGNGARWLVQRGFEAAGAELEPVKAQNLFERFLAHYLEHIADESLPFPGVEAALDALRAAGARLAVCTNKRTDLSKALLDKLDLSRRFEAIVGSDLTPAIKPDARHLAAAVQAVGGSMDRAIMVGDAATDAGAARAAGAGLILVSFGYTNIPARELAPDVLIDHFDELVDGCRALLRRA
jgi:phosphoglycolate phosphatase